MKGKEIALFNVDGEFFALDNTCTHRGGPLAEGEVVGTRGRVPGTAPLNIRTGEVVGSAGAAGGCSIRGSRDRNRHRSKRRDPFYRPSQ